MQKMYGYMFMDPHFIHLEVEDVDTGVEWRLSISKKTLYQVKMDNIQVDNKWRTRLQLLMQYAPTLKKFPAPLLKKCNMCGFRNNFENSPEQICFICEERMGQSDEDEEQEYAGGGSLHACSTERGSTGFRIASSTGHTRSRYNNVTSRVYSRSRGKMRNGYTHWDKPRKKYKHYLKGGLDCPKQWSHFLCNYSRANLADHIACPFPCHETFPCLIGNSSVIRLDFDFTEPITKHVKDWFRQYDDVGLMCKPLLRVLESNKQAMERCKDWMHDIANQSLNVNLALYFLMKSFPPEFAPEDLCEEFFKEVFSAVQQFGECPVQLAIYDIVQKSERRQIMRMMNYGSGNVVNDIEEVPLIDPTLVFQDRLEQMRKRNMSSQYCANCGTHHPNVYCLQIFITPLRVSARLERRKGDELRRYVSNVSEVVQVLFRNEYHTKPNTFGEMTDKVLHMMVKGFTINNWPLTFYTYNDKQIKNSSRSAFFIISKETFFAPSAIRDSNLRLVGQRLPGKAAARVALQLSETCSVATINVNMAKRIADIGDTKDGPKCKTDGCGNHNRSLCKTLYGRTDVSGGQFRFRGSIKGLFLVKDLPEDVLIEYRPSQVKFNNPSDSSLCLCQPITYHTAKLSCPLITNLLSLGIDKNVIFKKARDFYDRLRLGRDNKDIFLVYLWDRNKIRVGQKDRKLFDRLALSDTFDHSTERKRYELLTKDLESASCNFSIGLPKPSGRVMCAPDEDQVLPPGTVFYKYPAQPKDYVCMGCGHKNNRFWRMCANCGKERLYEYEVYVGDAILHRDPTFFPEGIRKVQAVYNQFLDNRFQGTCLVYNTTDNLSLAYQTSFGDYDGDMPLIICDPELINIIYLPPFIPKWLEETTQKDVNTLNLAKHFIEFQDQFGIMSINHRVQCDLLEHEGMANHPLCKDIARKIIRQLDANKKGTRMSIPDEQMVHESKTPKYLRTPWDEDGANTCAKDTLKEQLLAYYRQWKADKPIL